MVSGKSSLDVGWQFAGIVRMTELHQASIIELAHMILKVPNLKINVSKLLEIWSQRMASATKFLLKQHKTTQI